MLQNSHMILAHRRKHCRSKNKQSGTRRENRTDSYATIAAFTIKFYIA